MYESQTCTLSYSQGWENIGLCFFHAKAKIFIPVQHSPSYRMLSDTPGAFIELNLRQHVEQLEMSLIALFHK